MVRLRLLRDREAATPSAAGKLGRPRDREFAHAGESFARAGGAESAGPDGRSASRAGSDENGADDTVYNQRSGDRHPGSTGRGHRASAEAGPNQCYGESAMSQVAVASETKTEFPYFTEEHDMIRQTVKRFCLEEIRPYAEQWDHEGIFPRELFKKAADLGLFGIRINPEWGGSGLDWWASAAYMEAMAYAESGSVSMALMVQSEITLPALAELGTREQKEEFLRPAVAGDLIAALGISEPSGGSDVAALKTRARREGDHLVISGQKLWITNGTRADFIILAVRTGEEGHKGISFVILPTKTKGFSVGKKLKKVGNMASDTAELFFDECRIPMRNLLGEMNQGFYYVMHNFQGERLAAAILAVAGA